MQTLGVKRLPEPLTVLIDDFLKDYRYLSQIDTDKRILLHIKPYLTNEVNVNGFYRQLLEETSQRLKNISVKSNTRIKIGLISLLYISFKGLTKQSKEDKVRLTGNFLSIFQGQHLNVKNLIENSEIQGLIDYVGLLFLTFCLQPPTIISIFFDYEIKRAFNWLQDTKYEARAYSAINVLLIASRDLKSLFLTHLEQLFHVIWYGLSHKSSLVRKKASTCLQYSLELANERSFESLNRYILLVYSLAIKNLPEKEATWNEFLKSEQVLKQSSSLSLSLKHKNKWKRTKSTISEESFNIASNKQHVSPTSKFVRHLDGSLSILVVLLSFKKKQKEIKAETTVTRYMFEEIFHCIWRQELKNHQHHSICQKVVKLLPLLAYYCPKDRIESYLTEIFPFIIVSCQGDLYGFPNLDPNNSISYEKFNDSVISVSFLALGDIYLVKENGMFLYEYVFACLKMIRTQMMQTKRERSESISSNLLIENREQNRDELFEHSVLVCLAKILFSEKELLKQSSPSWTEIELLLPLLFNTGMKEISVLILTLVSDIVPSLIDMSCNILFSEATFTLLSKNTKVQGRNYANSIISTGNLSLASSISSTAKHLPWLSFRESFSRLKPKTSPSFSFRPEKALNLGMFEKVNVINDENFEEQLKWKKATSLQVLLCYKYFNESSYRLKTLDLFAKCIKLYFIETEEKQFIKYIYKAAVQFLVENIKIVLNHPKVSIFISQLFLMILTETDVLSQKEYIIEFSKLFESVILRLPDEIVEILVQGHFCFDNLLSAESIGFLAKVVSFTSSSIKSLKMEAVSILLMSVTSGKEFVGLNKSLRQAALFLNEFKSGSIDLPPTITRGAINWIKSEDSTLRLNAGLFLAVCVKHIKTQMSVDENILIFGVLYAFVKKVKIEEEFVLLCKAVCYLLLVINSTIILRIFPDFLSTLLEIATLFKTKDVHKAVLQTFCDLGAINPKYLSSNGIVINSSKLPFQKEESSKGLEIKKTTKGQDSIVDVKLNKSISRVVAEVRSPEINAVEFKNLDLSLWSLKGDAILKEYNAIVNKKSVPIENKQTFVQEESVESVLSKVSENGEDINEEISSYDLPTFTDHAKNIPTYRDISLRDCQSQHEFFSKEVFCSMTTYLKNTKDLKFLTITELDRFMKFVETSIKFFNQASSYLNSEQKDQFVKQIYEKAQTLFQNIKPNDLEEAIKVKLLVFLESYKELRNHLENPEIVGQSWTFIVKFCIQNDTLQKKCINLLVSLLESGTVSMTFTNFVSEVLRDNWIFICQQKDSWKSVLLILATVNDIKAETQATIVNSIISERSKDQQTLCFYFYCLIIMSDKPDFINQGKTLCFFIESTFLLLNVLIQTKPFRLLTLEEEGESFNESIVNKLKLYFREIEFSENGSQQLFFAILVLVTKLSVLSEFWREKFLVGQLKAIREYSKTHKIQRNQAITQLENLVVSHRSFPQKNMNNLFLNLKLKPRKEFILNNEVNEKLLMNTDRLSQSWSISQTPSSTDWSSWIERVQLESIRESPFSVFRCFSVLAQSDRMFSASLFNAAFLALWINISPNLQQLFVQILEQGLRSTDLEYEVLNSILKLLEYLELNDQTIYVDMSLLSSLALKCNAVATALYLKENTFKSFSYDAMHELITIYNKVGSNHAAEGLLATVERREGKIFKIEPEWYADVKQWKKAIESYSEKLEFENDNLMINVVSVKAIVGIIECLNKLGEWEVAKDIASYVLKTLHEDTTFSNCLPLRAESYELLSSVHTPFSISNFLRNQLSFLSKPGKVQIADREDINDCVNLEMANDIRKKIENSALILQSWSSEENKNTEEFTFLQDFLNERQTNVVTNLVNENISKICNEAKDDDFQTYNKVYPLVTNMLKWIEVKEITELRQSLKNEAVIKSKWQQRLLLMKPSVDRVASLLINRASLFRPEEDQRAWLWFSKLCVQNNRIRLAIRVFMSFGLTFDGDSTQPLTNISFLKPFFEDYKFEKLKFIKNFASKYPTPLINLRDNLSNVNCKVFYQFLKVTWNFGEKKESSLRLERLVHVLLKTFPESEREKYLKVFKSSNSSAEDEFSISTKVSGKAKKDLCSKMVYRLANWSLQLDSDRIRRFSERKLASKKMSGLLIEGKTGSTYLKQKIVYSRDLCEVSSSLNRDYYKAWHGWALLNYRLATEFENTECPGLLVKAISGFYRSLEISEKNSKSVVQDMLRILTIWFNYSHHKNICLRIKAGFGQVRMKSWLHVLPQLIARIMETGDLVSTLLIKVGREFPHELVYPLAVASAGTSEESASAASEILNTIKLKNRTLVDEAVLVSQELVRLAVVWEERWVDALEEAARLYFAPIPNTDGMLNLLLPLHEELALGPKSMNEVIFFQKYGRKLQLAAEWLQEYINAAQAARLNVSTGFSRLRSPVLRTQLSRGHNFYSEENYKVYLNQAWDHYQSCFKTMSKNLERKSIKLSFVSPKLSKLKNLKLKMPKRKGKRLIDVEISHFSSQVRIINSKQRPRVISIIGKNGDEFKFLLKGQEDLRLDERIMQLFQLVNSMIELTPEVMSIKCYSVTPLSRSVGIMEFIPETDTIHEVIRNYRTKRNIPINLELSLINEVTDDYDSLPLWEKLQIFESVLEDTSGHELRKVYWMRSTSAEHWLKTRNNFCNTLSTMSMVGYIIGLGDRHPSNLLIERGTGKIMHIDFGDCFELGMQRPKYPETVPFRLTRIMLNCLEICQTDGTFKQVAFKVLQLLRDNKESILTLLEAFLHDPLVNWKRHAEKTSNSTKLENDFGKKNNVSEEWSPHSYKTSENEDESNFDTDDSKSQNNFATEILKRVKDKLNGSDGLLGGGLKDNGELVTLTTTEQVLRLIEIATSNRELCVLYFGWCPYW